LHTKIEVVITEEELNDSVEHIRALCAEYGPENWEGIVEDVAQDMTEDELFGQLYASVWATLREATTDCQPKGHAALGGSE
jgi:hypothetical protein